MTITVPIIAADGAKSTVSLSDPVVSGPGTLIFSSDFAGTTAMGTPYFYSPGTNGNWPIVGTDGNFTWPINISGGNTLGLQDIVASGTLVANGNYLDVAGNHVFEAKIMSGTRHDGTTGNMLYRAELQNYDGAMQFPYVIAPGADVPDCLMTIWMKFGPNYLTALGKNAWSTFCEWKDTEYTNNNAGYRIALYVNTDSNGNPFWNMHGDNNPSGAWFWSINNTSIPIPINTWFKFDFAWHRTHDNTCFAWFKINNQLVAYQQGQGTNTNGFYSPSSTAPINRILSMQLYGVGTRSLTNPWDQYVDHIELRTGAVFTP